MFCSKCGSEISVGSAFCSKCGGAVNGTTTPPPPISNPSNSPTPKVVAASYGFNIKEEPGRITITVPKREVPDQTGLFLLLGCGAIIPVITFLAFACWFVFVVSSDAHPDSPIPAFYGSCIIGVIGFILILRAINSSRGQAFKEAVIVMDAQNISLNGTTFARSHVSSWSIRWKKHSGGSFMAVGSQAHVAAAAVTHGALNAAQAKDAEHSYCVTFDYGAKTVNAVGGMTEPAANRLMEAIQGCLDRV